MLGVVSTKGMYGILVPMKNINAPRDDKLALALQKIEEEEVHNLEEKQLMITRNGELVTIMKQQEEDKAQKSMEKE